MYKWVAIVVDRRILEKNLEEFQVVLTPEEQEILEEEDESPLQNGYKEVYVLVDNMRQIIDYKEIWATTPQDAAKKILLKYESCVFLHVELENSYKKRHLSLRNWFEYSFMLYEDQTHINLEELDHLDIIIRKELFCNISDNF